MTEPQILLATAAAIAFLHTAIGPDHYLVFTAMGKARRWSLSKTLRVTMLCGIGHVAGSVALGAIGILIGAELLSLLNIEGVRGSLAGYLLLAFGIAYFAWGLRQVGREHSHSHPHSHADGVVHAHHHDHHASHAHVHAAEANRSIAPWMLFIVFVLGPCEALIPLFMYPAAQHNAALVFGVAVVFSLVTIATMMVGVAITTLGIEKLKLPSAERYRHAIAGASIALCGGAISFLSI